MAFATAIATPAAAAGATSKATTTATRKRPPTTKAKRAPKKPRVTVAVPATVIAKQVVAKPATPFDAEVAARKAEERAYEAQLRLALSPVAFADDATVPPPTSRDVFQSATRDAITTVFHAAWERRTADGGPHPPISRIGATMWPLLHMLMRRFIYRGGVGGALTSRAEVDDIFRVSGANPLPPELATWHTEVRNGDTRAFVAMIAHDACLALGFNGINGTTHAYSHFPFETERAATRYHVCVGLAEVYNERVAAATAALSPTVKLEK